MGDHYHTKMADFEYSRVFFRFLVKKKMALNLEKCIEYGKERQSDW